MNNEELRRLAPYLRFSLLLRDGGRTTNERAYFRRRLAQNEPPDPDDVRAIRRALDSVGLSIQRKPKARK